MTVTSTHARPRSRILPAHPLRAALVIGSFVAVLWAVELVNQVVYANSLDNDGIVPRQVDGLDGILWAPFLHGSWEHLASNTVPLLVFGFLALAGGVGQFVAVTALIWLLGGLGTWLTGSGLTVGASGLIFGWFAFLLVRGFFARSVAQIAVAVVLFALWGGILWGALPGGNPLISWQAHLFGALAGILGARLVASADRSRRPRLRGSDARGANGSEAGPIAGRIAGPSGSSPSPSDS